MFGLGKKKKKKEEKEDIKVQLKKDEKELQRDLSLIDERILEDTPYRLSGEDLKKIETGIDTLYSMVKEKKSLGAVEAAKSLKVSEETVTEWANIMEEHEMLRVHYPLFGRPVLRSMDWKPRWKTGKKKDKKKKKGKGGKEALKLKHLKFTKKRIFIMAEIIVLSEILIYIFLVNRSLSTNFLPTVIQGMASAYIYLMQNRILLLIIPAIIVFIVLFLVMKRKKIKPRKKRGK